MSSDVALTTALTILIIVDISGNCLVCWVVKRNRDMRFVVSVIEYSAVCPLVIGLISSLGVLRVIASSKTEGLGNEVT